MLLVHVRVFTLLLCLALVYPASTFAQGTGEVTGIVSDAESGRPLSGARISISGSARGAVTDERGQYRIEGLARRNYTITATFLGQQPASQLVHLTQSTEATVDFALKPASVLLSDVIVSASRSPQSPREVAATVNVMSREQIRTNPARTTDDLLREMPGVELPRTSSTVSGPEEIVSIRGSDEGRTLVMLDNVPLNDPWGEWIQWNRAPRFQLDRAEVLEGGGSSLYGNYAMGGVISLFTQPIFKRAYSLMASGGSRGAGDFSLYGSDLRGPLGASLSADYGTGGGYTVLRSSQRGTIDQASSVTRRNVNGRAEYTLATIGSLFASGNYFDDDRSLGTPLTEPNRRRIVSGVFGGNFGGLLGGSVEARAFGQRQNYDSHSSVVNATRTAERPNVAQHIPSHDLGGSLQWSRSIGMLQLLSIGGDYRHMVGELNELVYNAAGGIAGTRNSGGSQQVGGAFVQGVLAPIEPLRIEASARLDAWRSYNGSRIDNTAVPPTTTTYPAKSNSAFAPRIGVRYRLLNSLTLRSSFYKAFRAPTLSEEYRTFFAGPNTFMGNPLLTPEYLTGYDVGVNWEPLPAFELRATGFWNTYKNLDDFTFLSPGTTPGSAVLQRQNVGSARSRGAEGEIALQLLQDLTLSASYNYDLARVVATKAFVNRVPLQRGAARLTYESPRIATINAIFRYEGPNHALGGARLSPYGLMDLDARHEVRSGADIFASMENLFDRQYTINFQGPLESIGLPRTVRGGVSLRSF
ncbi:MAG: TonB-dependent receptor [Gemmatimonadota bacterium]|nr:TonB-dependent receptor [Gemmatimonadota bacterium]